MDQTYYESVYAQYTAPAPQYAQPEYAPPQYAPPAYVQPAAYEQPAFEQPAYEQPRYAQPEPQPQYEEQFYAQPQYEAQPQYNFHDPSFDTGEFEAIYQGPGSTEASYDLLPDEGYSSYDAYDGDGAYDDDDDYVDEYTSEYADAGEPAVDDDDEPDDRPLRSRSRSGPSGPVSGRPFGSKPVRGVQISGRRTLHAITSTPAAVVGVAAVAVAAVGGLRLPSNHTENTADAASPAAPTTTNALEQNLLQMRAASANLADRATRSEQRSELAQQQALEKQRLAEMAPKYFLPVQDYILTAGFGDAGARWASLHTGQDFAVPTGTKVVAVTDGTVIESGWAGAFGKRIVIQHPDGSETWYCHLSVIRVASGKVASGQIIALSGDTGNSTGPHLHFEYHPPGPADPMNGVPGASTAVNPVPFLRNHGLLP
ncbi:MAG: peptidoglycan DD-metalloendopeptidase family protein [Catenulispora sp.]